MAPNIKKDFDRNKNRKPELTTLVYGKVPPQAAELETAVLGACLLEKQTFEQVVEILPSADCFYMDAHQKVYDAMRTMYDRGADVDLLTVTEELRKRNELELVGGAYFLVQLTTSVVSSAHVMAHSRIVMEKFIQRELIRISGKTIGDAYEDSTDVFDLLDKVETEVYQVSQRMLKKDYANAQKVVRQVMDMDAELMEQPEGLAGLPSGNHDLDAITGGFKPGKVYVFAARPSVGKTAFALNIVHHLAVDGNTPIGFFSLEMENDELLRRIVSIHTKINTYKVDYPKSRTPEEQAAISLCYQKLAQSKFFFDETPALTVMELRAKARRMVNKNCVKIIFIDYLQLMQGDSGQSWNREAEVSKISREIKRLAKELKIPIVPLCQLNRDIEKRSNNKFMLSDLRESGGIEQDADFVGFLWRPDDDDIKKEPELEGMGKVNVAKIRGGKKGTVLYSADMSTQTWANYERFAPKPQPQEPQKPYAGMGYRQPEAVKTTTKNPETIDDLPF